MVQKTNGVHVKTTAANGDHSADFYRKLVESAGEVIFTTDPQGHFTYVNPTIQSMLGYLPDELSNRHFAEFIVPAWRETVSAFYGRQYREAIPRTTLEFPVVAASGEERWVEQILATLSENGSITGFLGFVRDVSDRKRAEDDLAGERNLLRTLIDLLPEDIYVKDSQNRYLLGNQSVADTLGVSTDSLIGKRNADLLPAGTTQTLDRDDQEILGAGSSLINREELLVTHAGIRRWFLTSKVPLRDRQGNIVGLVGVSRDITERKQYEDELQNARDELERRVIDRTSRLSEANAALKQEVAERKQVEARLAAERNRLRTLIDNLPDCIFVKDAQCRFVICNEAVARVMGVASPDLLVGKTDFDFYDSDHAEQYFADDRKVILSGQALVNHVEPHISPTTGAMRWLLTTKVPLRDADNKIIGLVGIGHDITERQQEEDAHRQHKEFLQQLIDINPSLIFVKDANGKFTLANKALASFLGTEVDALIGKDQADFGIPREVVDRLQRDDNEVLRSRIARFIPEESIPHQVTGELHWFQTLKAPLVSADSSTYQLLCVATDITGRKHAEQQAVELGSQRERVKMLADFVRDASHDLRTPLSTINTSLYLLRKTNDSDKRYTYIDSIQHETTHLSRLIEGLLTMMRLDGDLTLTMTPTDVNSLIRMIDLHGNRAAAAKHLTINIDLAPEPLMILANAVELERALSEVIANAVQFTPEEGDILLRTYADEGEVAVEIGDTGIGIDSAHLPRIFERFYRADKARSVDTGGVGLGLSIAQKIVDMHGGKITVESTPGQGTTFRFVLPAQR